jgi:tetratricopeptide (TPR) repeat protein
MRSIHMTAVVMLIVLAPAMGLADPTVESLLSLKPEGMSEGDRLQNSAYCLAAGRKAQDQGKFGAALDLYNKCLELNSEEMEAHLQKGRLFGDERVGLRAQAISELLLYVAANPADGNALADLGVQYMRTGRMAEAEDRFKLAVSRDPGDPGPKGFYGILLISFTDRVKEGVDLEKAALKGIPEEPWFWMNLAWGQVRLGRYAEARASAAGAITAMRAQGWGQQAVDEMNQLLREIERK